jgi:hypothetical protein
MTSACHTFLLLDIMCEGVSKSFRTGHLERGNGTALCHYVQLYRYFVSHSSEFCRHGPLCCFSTSVYCCLLFISSTQSGNFWIYPHIGTWNHFCPEKEFLTLEVASDSPSSRLKVILNHDLDCTRFWKFQRLVSSVSKRSRRK